ncbi:MAG: cytochrome c, partial [Acidobacteria bacterium]|nr:cytochrome c [Acidobacteriota bacterium]
MWESAAIPVRPAAVLAAMLLLPAGAGAQAPAGHSGATEQALLERYCVTCHNDSLRTAGLSLEALDLGDLRANAETWEKVVLKLRAGMMPPAGRPRPDRETYDRLASFFETDLDRAAAADPDPGHSDALRRLTATEYGNDIRDLL